MFGIWFVYDVMDFLLLCFLTLLFTGETRVTSCILLFDIFLPMTSNFTFMYYQFVYVLWLRQLERVQGFPKLLEWNMPGIGDLE